MCRCVAVYDYVKRHAGVHGGQKRVSDAPGQMVQTSLNFLRVGAGNGSLGPLPERSVPFDCKAIFSCPKLRILR